jgi:DNA-binding response OmpR family regulator
MWQFTSVSGLNEAQRLISHCSGSVPDLLPNHQGGYSMAGHILIVDDDDLLRRSLAYNLERANYQVKSAATAEAALELAYTEQPDLILLDIGLPGMDGLEALRQLRQQIPVIFVTARSRPFDEVLGLELGADDYIVKPFDFEVLLARVRAVLRRASHENQRRVTSGPLIVGDLVIDVGAYTVMVGDRRLLLPPREFRLLYTLALNAGNVVLTEQIIEQVWGAEFQGESQIVYVHIRSLREKLEQDPAKPKRIITVRGVGYKLAPQEG